MPVVDASIAIAFLLPDEDGSAFDSLYKDHPDSLIAPTFLDLELVNAVINAVRSQRLTEEAAARLARNVMLLPIARIVPDDALLISTFTLARSQNLSAYDALYLALAKARDLPLATSDRRLATAARAEGVPLVP